MLKFCKTGTACSNRVRIIDLYIPYLFNTSIIRHVLNFTCSHLFSMFLFLFFTILPVFCFVFVFVFCFHLVIKSYIFFNLSLFSPLMETKCFMRYILQFS